MTGWSTTSISNVCIAFLGLFHLSNDESEGIVYVGGGQNWMQPVQRFLVLCYGKVGYIFWLALPC